MSTLYDIDIVEWSEQQAALLRRHAEGERAADPALDWANIDWDNIIDEVESVGLEQLHAVESLLLRALVHLLKAEAWPEARDAPAWRADAINCRAQAANRFAPSMRQRIDLARLYRQAVRAVPATNGGQPPLKLPDACPVTLDGLLADAS